MTRDSSISALNILLEYGEAAESLFDCQAVPYKFAKVTDVRNTPYMNLTDATDYTPGLSAAAISCLTLDTKDFTVYRIIGQRVKLQIRPEQKKGTSSISTTSG